LRTAERAALEHVVAVIAERLGHRPADQRLVVDHQHVRGWGFFQHLGKIPTLDSVDDHPDHPATPVFRLR
jgi:hypothetical protein